jgi:DhnA family fructose-bisphosphate aldolase class Ia
MLTGKALRMRRIMDPSTHTTLMFAFSHGTSAPQVLPGLENPVAQLEAVRTPTTTRARTTRPSGGCPT